jgi:DNA-binding SARP family transcriptional activator
VGVEFGLLGPLLIRGATGPVEIGAAKQRALLICLLLRPGRTVPVDRLIDALWGDDPPAQARITLRSYVSNLRRALGAPGAEPFIVTSGNGYSAQVDPASIDAVRFERLVEEARRQLGAHEPAVALDLLDEGLGLWRGDALADVAGSAFARGERTRLEELRLTAEEDRFDALLALGRHAEAVAALEAFVAAAPLRERARGQLMLGLYRSGRAADALAAFARFRATLVEELGLDPSSQLQQLADRILNQAADLEPTTPGVAAAVASTRVQETPAPVSGLVGRVYEQRALQASVARLLGGEGGLLLLAGEPGIGKTALLEELARLGHAAGVAVHWGRCHQSSGAPAFWPWIQLLRGICRGVSDDDLRALVAGPALPVTQLLEASAQRVVEHHPAGGDDLEAARFQLYDATATFLVRAVEGGPLVLVLDDLHWADTPSLQMLAFLTPLLASTTLLVAGSYRDLPAEWADELEATLAAVVREPVTRQLGLVGLQPAAVAELAEEVTGKPVTGDVAEMLHQRTAGNPFFVRQLSQLLHEEHFGRAGDPRVPIGVRHVIARRLGMLSAQTRSVLETAAVMGGQFDVRRLAAAAGIGIDDTLTAAGHAAAHGMLQAAGGPGSRYRFVHALVRETIYESLSPQRAARLHAQVATALEHVPQVPAAELAEHFWRAADLIGDDRPVRYLVAAADQALEVLAYEQAETALCRALEISSRDAEVSEALARQRMHAASRLSSLRVMLLGYSAPETGEALRMTRTLARTAGGRRELVAALWGLGAYHIVRAEFSSAEALADELLSIDPGDAATLASGHHLLGVASLHRGRLSRSLEHLDRALASVDLPSDAWPDERFRHHLGVAIRCFLSGTHALQGDLRRTTKTTEDALARASATGAPFDLAMAHFFRAWGAITAEQPEGALEASQAILAISEAHNFRFWTAAATVQAGWARSRLGDPDAGEVLLREGLTVLRAAGSRMLEPYFLGLLADVQHSSGRSRDAEATLRRAQARADEVDEHLWDEQLRRLSESLRGGDSDQTPPRSSGQ